MKGSFQYLFEIGNQSSFRLIFIALNCFSYKNALKKLMKKVIEKQQSIQEMNRMVSNAQQFLASHEMKPPSALWDSTLDTNAELVVMVTIDEHSVVD